MNTQPVHLKPCPCCGKTPIIHRSVFSEQYRIRCESGCGLETAPFGTKEKAVEAWNRRYEDENIH